MGIKPWTMPYRMMEKFEDFDGESYQVVLPFSGDHPDLPFNFQQAMRRLRAVERRMAGSDKAVLITHM
ncbi:hypothetical protein T12_1925 [Trichinella patagoniensis]|uniref:Uncharacterized protein n=1 Tax=Trichinella patagoniensis TaxID=990121 RepID=A0A0V0ZSJ5_9BILA|nr:hypothetical protein T12_1925 [Trichinella patagoniensis]